MNTTEIPNNLTEARNRLETKMMDTLLFFETRLKRSIPIPSLELKPLGLVWGRAVNTQSETNKTIQINSDLLVPHLITKNWNHLHDHTMPHEVCHHVAPLIHNNWRHGNYRGHGRAWKECMLAIGLRPERCHHMDEETVQTASLRTVTRKYAYKCNCPNHTHFLTSIRHNRFQQGKYNRLHCLRCKATLVYFGEKI